MGSRFQSAKCACGQTEASSTRRNRQLGTILTAFILAAVMAGTAGLRAQGQPGPIPPPSGQQVPKRHQVNASRNCLAPRFRSNLRSGKEMNGPWGAPTMMALEGGSFGLQLGGQATDFILLVMNARGADSVLSSKVKLGVGIAAAAGPKGRDASAATDVALRAEILSYSRSRGLFAGAYLDGSTLRPDNNANQKVYGKNLTAKEIALEGKAAPPSSAEELLATLNKRSPRHSGD
jgi:Las17-binding protein actin regulator